MRVSLAVVAQLPRSRGRWGARAPAATARAAAPSDILVEQKEGARLLLSPLRLRQHFLATMLPHERQPMFLLLMSLPAAVLCMPSARRKAADTAELRRIIGGNHNKLQRVLMPITSMLHTLPPTCSSSFPLTRRAFGSAKHTNLSKSIQIY